MATGSFLATLKASETGWGKREVERPIFKKSAVLVSVWEDGQFSELPRDRADATVVVIAPGPSYDRPESERAWEHFIAERRSYETAIREALWPLAKRAFLRASEENQGEPDWDSLVERYSLKEIDSLEAQLELKQIGVVLQAGEEIAGLAFDLRAGWHGEWGYSVLTRLGAVLEIGQPPEFLRSS